MTDRDTDADLVARVATVGETEVGRRYVERQGRGRPADGDEWIDDAVDYGDGLPVETRYRLIAMCRRCVAVFCALAVHLGW